MAKITLGPDGVRLFRMCPPRKATCADDEATEISLSSLGVSAIAAPPGLAVKGTGVLKLPKPRPQDNRPVLEITVAGTYTAPSTFGMAISVKATNGAWPDAFGIPGLGVNGLAFEFAATVNPPNGITPTTFAILGDVQSFPQFMVDALGIVGSGQEHARVAFKISATDLPIFEFTLGEPTIGGAARIDYLKPVKFYVPARQDDLKVDVASLVFAPLGGKIGEFTYQPGVNLRFAATILGVGVNVEALVDLTAPRISAHVAVTPITISGLTIDQTSFDLDASLSTGFLTKFSGGFSLPNGGPRIDASMEAKATIADGLKFRATSTGKAWTLAPGVVLNDFAFDSVATLPTMSATPAGSLSAKANAIVFGTAVPVAGSVTTDGGTVKKFTFTGGSGPISLVPGTAISGTGCPAGAGPAGAPTTGPCVTIGFDNTRPAPKGSIDFNGALTANGLKASVHGAVDGNRTLLDGSLDTGNFGSVAVTGRLYSGSFSAIETDHLGVPRNVTNGDWKVTATVRPVSIRGFSGNLAFSAGKLGASQWVQGVGSSKIGESTVNITGLVAIQGAGFSVDPNASPIGAALSTGVLNGGVRRVPVAGRLLISHPASLVPVNAVFSGTLRSLPRRTVPAPPAKPRDGRTSNAAKATVAPIARLSADPRFVGLSGVQVNPALLSIRPRFAAGFAVRKVPTVTTISTTPTLLPPTGTAVIFSFTGDANLVLGGISLANAHVQLTQDSVRAEAILTVSGLANTSS